MNQQQPDPARPRPRRATTRGKTSPSNGSQLPEKAPARPAPGDSEGWKTYWKELQQPWRTEPEIDAQRQGELAKRRDVPPDWEKGIYPFSGMKLSRADLEWLLATHEEGRGPVNWSDENQRERKGLDLRGADLSMDGDQQQNLTRLPLTGLISGLKRLFATEEQKKCARMILTRADLSEAQLEGADLYEAQLQGANLSGAQLQGGSLIRAQLQGANLSEAQLQGGSLNSAQLQGANLIKAQLQGANLSGAQLEGAHLDGAQLQGVDFSGAQLQRAHFDGAQLEGADLREAQLEGAHLMDAQLQRANLMEAQLEGAYLGGAQLQGAYLSMAQLQGVNFSEAQLQRAHLDGAQLQRANFIKAQLQGAYLIRAQLQRANLSRVPLQGAYLIKAQLQGADLDGAQLEGADLSEAQLEGADLREARLEGADLGDVILASKDQVGPYLADIQWGTINLAVVDWSQMALLGDDDQARQKYDSYGIRKQESDRLQEHRAAVRANRQLSVVLQGQGLNEDAARFAYRANLLQRRVLWFQMVQPKTSLRQRIRKFGAWVFSHLLNLIAGYGYRPERSFLAYLLVIFGFMGLYLLTSHFTTPHLRWDEALVLSLSSFHGRGFFTQTITLGDAYARLAVAEAVLGLFIEISFIATFTQRFFGK